MCPICGGLGFVTYDLPVGHPDFGRAFPCDCQRDAFEERKAARLRALSNLDVVEDKTFETFDRRPLHYTPEQVALLRECYSRAREYADRPEGWLLFQGSYGSGKTHLALAIANHRLQQDDDVLFMTTPDLLDHLRATYGPSSQIEYDALFERVRNTALLVLDDLGTESPTPWAQEKLFQLLNHRYLHRLPTVLTMNLDEAQLDPRLRSRLGDRNLVRRVDMDLPDYRTGEGSMEQAFIMGPGLHGELWLYKKMTFKLFDVRENELPPNERRNLQAALNLAKDWARNPVGWLVLLGPHGSGKTHLAAAIANYRHAKFGEPVMIVTVPDLLDYLRAAFSAATTINFTRRFHEIRTANLLILDQLDLTNASSWALEKIRQIVNYRYLAELPTVFTTTQELESIDPLIGSRLLDARLCTVFSILAPDYAGGPAKLKSRRNWQPPMP